MGIHQRTESSPAVLIQQTPYTPIENPEYGYQLAKYIRRRTVEELLGMRKSLGARGEEVGRCEYLHDGTIEVVRLHTHIGGKVEIPDFFGGDIAYASKLLTHAPDGGLQFPNPFAAYLESNSQRVSHKIAHLSADERFNILQQYASEAMRKITGVLILTERLPYEYQPTKVAYLWTHVAKTLPGISTRTLTGIINRYPEDLEKLRKFKKGDIWPHQG